MKRNYSLYYVQLMDKTNKFKREHEIFKDKGGLKKNKEGYALIHIKLESKQGIKETRYIVFGAHLNCNKVFEFQVVDNKLEEIKGYSNREVK